MSTKTVFLGGGNMAEALLKGMLSAEKLSPESTWVTDIREERLSELHTTYGVHTTTRNDEAILEAEQVWLCVKPQQFEELLSPLAGKLDGALVVSIAAGVTCATIESLLGESTRVVRVMPNTPALVGQGMAGVAAGSMASGADVDEIVGALECVGQAVKVSEQDLHAVTAISGSGPAYVFYLIEHLQQAGEELGLESDTARALALQTVKGASHLMEQTGEPAGLLRERVTSKGGTTAAALQTFGDKGVGEGIQAGAAAAAQRSRELAGEA